MWCSCRVDNIFTLGKLLHLWFCFLLHSILFFISQTSYWRASEASETLSGLFNRESYIYIYIYINTMAECRSGRKCVAVK